jgi:hypothetical protein
LKDCLETPKASASVNEPREASSESAPQAGTLELKNRPA